MNLKKVVAGDEPVTTPSRVTFTDTVFTSRSLFLQQGEMLRRFDVAGQRVTVSTDDAEALTFLDEHPDMQRMGG